MFPTTKLTLAIVLSGTVLLHAEGPKLQLPEATGKATTLRLCGTCHGAEIVMGHPRSEEGWGDVVANMIQRGAPGTEDEFYEIIQYLTKNIKALPKVNVNKATAQEIEDGLGLTTENAKAIVDAREKGEFKSLDDLKKVPGIPAAKIVSRKNLISFQ